MNADRKDSKKVGKRIKFLFSFLVKVIFGFILISVIIYSIFRIPAVQQYIKNSIIQTVEQRTGSKITFDHVAISIWNGVTLENFKLEYEEYDSLISVKKLGFSLRKNLLYLINKELNISTLRLEGVTILSETKYLEESSGLSRFFSKLIKPNAKGEKVKFLLQIQEILFKDILIKIINENKGTREYISLKSGYVELDKLDIENNEFLIDQVYLNNPIYKKIIVAEKRRIVEDLEIQTEDENLEKDWFAFSFSIKNLEVEEGVFRVQNNLIPKDTKFSNVLDYNHFEFRNIKILLDEIKLSENDEFFGICKNVSFDSDKNFTLEKLSIDTIQVLRENTKLAGVLMETNGSKFLSTISLNYFNYSAFSNFNEEVLFNLNVDPSYIDLKDITHFYKGLITNPVTLGISDKIINLSGRYFGKLTGINGRNINISVGNQLSFGGSFSSKNLDDYNNTLLNIRLENFVSSMLKIKSLFPTFNLPENFYKLGTLRFNGRYDGYLEDFVAYGKLNTDLGSVDLDMRLDITSGVERALYSGELNLSAFDLARWSGNPDFGLVYFTSKVKKGQGLTLKTLKSDIQAEVKSLTYKGYEYKSFFINGIFEKNNFNGFFEINDPNIDVKFDGNAEFIENQAFLNFKSTIKNLDLYALHLSQKPFSFKAELDINASGSNINDILGNIDIENLIIKAQDTSFHVEEIHLTSRNVISGGKELKIWSELGDFLLVGEYDFNKIVPLVVGIVRSNYPSITKNWSTKIDPTPTGQSMEFDISLKDSKHFLRLVGLNNVRFSRLDVKGKIDSYNNEISIASNIPLILMNNDSVQNVQILVNSYKNTGDIIIHTDRFVAMGESFGSVDFHANSKGDSIIFDIFGNEIVKSMKPLSITGFMIPYEDGYSFSIQAEQLSFLGADWTFSKDNRISVTKDFLEIEQFELWDGHRKISLDDIDNKGLSVYLENFDIEIMNKYLKDNRFSFSGISTIKVEIDDIYGNERNISSTVLVPSFYINKDHYGEIDLVVDMDKKGMADIDLLVGNFLTANFLLNTKSKFIEGKAKLKEAPLKLLEYVLSKGIQNTAGTIDANVDISGPLKSYSLNGKGVISKGETKLIYTGVTYYFDNQSFSITESYIDFTGAILTDARNNPASITGGLTHNRFTKFGVNAYLSGDNIIALQTTRLDNPDYYGFSIGRIRASFTGSFENVDMVIDGVTNTGTQLFIPVGNSTSKAQNSTIRFEKRNLSGDTVLTIPKKILKGIDLEMNLTITPDALISIIFSEDKGDLIRAVGRGNMQIFIKRTGVFDIFGEYEIESGNYLFTVAQLPVAKPFEVIRGGTIRWTGDPVNATMSIQAVYKSRTSLRPFIIEYLGFASEELSSQANQRQDVNVILNVGGTLYNPEVTFNLAFPNLVGDLATLTDSKMRVLQNNELELNSQVFGLIMFNNFLPSNRVSDVLGSGGIQTMGINTLSEFLSSQLSLYITSLINLALVENGLLAGVDFEIGLRNNTGVVSNIGNTNIWPDEIEFRLKNRFKFLDERVTLNMGGNYIFESQGLTYNQMLPDFSLELILTEDRKLKARIYGRQELIVQNTLSPKVGLGLAYRTEFGSLTDFEESLKNAIKKSIINK